MGQEESSLPFEMDLYEIELKRVGGQAETMSKYRGKVCIVVNLAENGVFVSQLKGLEYLYQKYKDNKLVILGFPSNDIIPASGSERDFEKFAKENFGVTFPLFEKTRVVGDGKHMLYTYLTSKETNPKFSGKIDWSFTKFLIGADGTVINRYTAWQDLSEQKLEAEVVEALKLAARIH